MIILDTQFIKEHQLCKRLEAPNDSLSVNGDIFDIGDGLQLLSGWIAVHLNDASEDLSPVIVEGAPPVS